MITEIKEQTQVGLIIGWPDNEDTFDFDIGDIYYLQVNREGIGYEMEARVLEKQTAPVRLVYLLKTDKIIKIPKRVPRSLR